MSDKNNHAKALSFAVLRSGMPTNHRSYFVCAESLVGSRNKRNEFVAVAVAGVLLLMFGLGRKFFSEETEKERGECEYRYRLLEGRRG